MKPATPNASDSPARRSAGADGYPRLFGPYVLLKPLARGGMGALYLALTGERGMEKLCVIKTVLNHLADRSYMQRFRDEAKVVVRLSHGNLVSVFDAGQVTGEIFLAMDFIEGKDLRAVWNRCAQKGIAFPIDVAVHIIKELSRGLGYAHSFSGLNLVHRDVSPPNVLLSYSGEVRLTDFGLASSTLKLEKTAPGIIYGKVSYMPPEQARGEALDARADIYAAGIILWELLTGRQLFPASTGLAGAGNGEDDLLERVRQPTAEPPSAKTKRVPPELDRIVVKALAIKPEDRYQSGEAFRADLAAFQARTSPATDGEHVARFLRRLFGEDIEREATARERLMLSGASLLAAPGTPPPPSTASFLADESGERTPQLRRPNQRPQPPKGGTQKMDPSALADDHGDTQHDPPRGSPRKGDTEAIGSPVQGTSTADATSQAIGAVLAGRYRIVRLVGEGGMGRVYEAEHVEIGKRVAIKVLHPAYTRTPDVVERFRREARAASRIGHLNIVNVTDSGTTEDGSFFFVMEFIEGIELGLAVHRGGPMSIKRTLRIADQMCQALQAAHDAGVIHRDLKPENVLLVTKGNRPDYVKVLDFGIAKSADVDESSTTSGGAGKGQGRRLTRPGVAMGTPEYMAPEQAAGKAADPRSDIYAVGSIIYEMLTGSPPYEGENVMEVLHKKATEMPIPLRERRPDVPEAVGMLVERAMARRPEDRPQTMAALGAEIALVLEALVGRRTPTEVLVDIRRELSGQGDARSESADLAATTIDPGSPITGTAVARHARLAAVISLLSVVGLVVVKTALSQKPENQVVIAAAQISRPDEPAIDSHGATLIPAPETVTPVAPDESEAVGATDAGGEPPEWQLAAADEEEPAPGQAALPPDEVGDSAPEPDEVEETGNDRRARSKRARIPAAKGRRILQDGKKSLSLQKYDDARDAFNKLLAMKQFRGEAFVGLGQVAFQEKNYKRAVQHARSGAAAGGGVMARVLLGDAYFKLNDYAGAQKAYEDALKLDPKNSVAQNNLEFVKRRMN